MNYRKNIFSKYIIQINSKIKLRGMVMTGEYGEKW